MRKDPTEFRNRFLRWKNGENPYSAGRIVDAIYKNNPKEEFLGEPSHNYDFTQSEEWANAHGYYPDERGHRDDRVKKPAHPSHPSRGSWDRDKFVLTDKGMLDPNYTLFGLNDGGLDPLAILTHKGSTVLPEITVTPKGNYIYNSYDNIKLHLPKHANGKLPKYGDGKPKGDGLRYLWDDQSLSWDRITDSDVANAMAEWAFTPTTTRAKFNYENTPNPVKPLQKNAVISQDNNAWTKKRVTEESNKRTWRSDAADVAHAIGEGAMLASNFAAPEIEPLVYPAYNAAKTAIINAAQVGMKKTAPVILSTMMRPQMQLMPSVINRFRNQEWSNFLSTKNADAYFRINAGNKPFSGTEKYFISHTTPWEEFSGLGSEHDIGGTVLYEFPTNTFGKMRSSSDTGVLTNYDVTELGKKHLLYGNTASGKRGPVQIIPKSQVEAASKLGIDDTKIGILNRPLDETGLYDDRPIYENIRMGNLTVLRGRQLNRALKNTEYKKYIKTPNGIQREIYVPGIYNGMKPDWKNPINNALSVELQDAMLGEYVGHGAERQVFTDRRYPGRVIKIGGGLNGETKIQNFDQLRDAVEYTMEMNRLPGAEPISYEGFIDEKGVLIPWFSQKQVFPMNSVADPFHTFSKPMLLPNGKPITKGKLAALRRIDYDKLLNPLGYKETVNGFELPNYPYPVKDLGQKNIGFDAYGNLRIFDPLIEL